MGLGFRARWVREDRAAEQDGVGVGVRAAVRVRVRVTEQPSRMAICCTILMPVCRAWGDAGEMQGRCARDVREMCARCARDVREMWGRCARDVGEM